MRSFLKFFVVAFALLTANASAAEIPASELKCNTGEICLDQESKQKDLKFSFPAGTVVQIEVSAKNGATVKLESGGNTMTSSYLQIGNTGTQQSVLLKTTVAADGIININVEPAKITVNGVEQNPDGGVYKIKITRLSSNMPGESI